MHLLLIARICDLRIYCTDQRSEVCATKSADGRSAYFAPNIYISCYVCVCVGVGDGVGVDVGVGVGVGVCVSGYDNCWSSDNFRSTLAIVRAIMPLSGHRVRLRLNVARSTRNNRYLYMHRPRAPTSTRNNRYLYIRIIYMYMRRPRAPTTPSNITHTAAWLRLRRARSSHRRRDARSQ